MIRSVGCVRKVYECGVVRGEDRDVPRSEGSKDRIPKTTAGNRKPAPAAYIHLLGHQCGAMLELPRCTCRRVVSMERL